MKCAWNQCGKETNQECPKDWIKHKAFDPRALHMLFDGTQYEDKLKELRPFVCSECMPLYEAYLKRSNSSKQGAKTRKTKKQEDYSI